MMNRANWGGMAAILVSCFTCLPAWGQGRSTVEGSWEGALVYVPAEQEVEIIVDLFQDSRGVLAGLIDHAG